MDILRFDDLSPGGFAGLREKRFVTDRRVFGRHKKDETSDGIGNFVYLADANFMPNGETGLHPHHEVDVISVMVAGRIRHAGSLEHGQSLETGSVQVQRAGSEGFTHNEINPDATENQMIQLWVLPDTPGEPAGYKVYRPETGERAHVYGGSTDQNVTFHSETSIDVLHATPGQTVFQPGEVMVYISRGEAVVNGQDVGARTLVRVTDLDFAATSDAQVILVYMA